MKKTAWTMAEMILAIVIIAMLSSICATIFKPNIQKARFFVYSAIRDIVGANTEILDKEGSLSDKTLTSDDWYCVYLADLFNLNSAADCTKTAAGADTVNIRYANGLTMQGLASPWVAPFTGSYTRFKNFVIDINGSSGPNKVWVDRFPLRVIAGAGYGVEGMVVAVNCGSEVIYNATAATPADVSVVSGAKNPYCKDGFSANGTASTKDYTTDKQILSYDIYRADNEDDDAKANVIASGVSQKEADCAAYGGYDALNSPAVCNTAKIKLLKQCATQYNCEKCLTDNCPADGTTPATCKTLAATQNPNNIDCVTMLHKPSIGAHFIIQAIVGNLDEDFN